MSPFRLPCVALVTVLVLTATGSASGTATTRSRNVYLTGFSDTVDQFDAAADGSLTPKTPPSLPAGHDPSWGIAVSPDGGSLYVTNAQSNDLSQYSIAPDGALTPKAPATVPTGTMPYGIAVSPDGKSVYVANQNGDDVSQYDVGANGALTPKAPATVPAGVNPIGIALTPDGKSVYVANLNGGNVSQYDVGAGGRLSPKAAPPVPAVHGPWGIAVTPDGKHVYVSNWGDQVVSQYAVGSSGALQPLSPASVATARSSPEGIAVTPDGSSLYVVDNADGSMSQDGSVDEFDIRSDGTLAPKSTASIPIGRVFATDLAVSPDGKSVYVTLSGEGSVWRYTTGSGGLLSPVHPPVPSTPTDVSPEAVVVRPDPGPVAAFSATVGRAGGRSVFDASGEDGSVTRWQWSFGDGTASTGSQVRHSYARPGTYRVTLQVTDEAGCSAAVVFTGQTAYCPADPAAVATRTVRVRPALPAVSGLRFHPRVFRAQSVVRWRDTRPALTTFTVARISLGYRSNGACVARRPLQAGGRCPLHREVRGKLTHRDAVGANRIIFEGRWAGRLLPAGTYRLEAVPRAGPEGSKPAFASFTIRP